MNAFPGFRGPAAASRALGALAAVIVAAIAAVAGVSIWQLHQQAERAAWLNAENAAAALAAHAQQVFSSAAYVLDGLRTTLEAEGTQDMAAFKRRFSGRETHALLRGEARSFQALDVLSIVAADGDLVNFSRGFPVPPMNIRNREGVDTGWGSDNPGALLVTAPRVALVNGRWTFYLVRQLRAPDGQVVGLVQAGIGSAYFSDFYQQLRVTSEAPGAYPTTLTLMRNDAVVLAMAPHDDNRLGRPRPEMARPSLADPVIAVQELQGFPARVAAAVEAKDYLAAWRRQAWLVAGLAVLSSVLLSATFALMVRVMRRREHALEADRRLRIEAERADRAKTEFLSTITHELRTPMNGVIGTAELLLHERRPERQRELAETILGSGRKLLGIINDILDLTKIDAGEVPVQHSPFDPAAVAEEVRRLLADSAERKGLALLTQPRGAIPAAVTGDAGHVREILIRLVGNAIKFTDQGSVLIAVEPGAGGSAGGVRYLVEDSGIGIPADARSRLFKPFAQVDTSAKRRHDGTGLGLALAQRLAGLLGSRIDFEPLPSGGTRFWFELPPGAAGMSSASVPLRAGPTPTQGAGVAPAWPRRDFPPHVLVVEDDPVNAMIVQEQLSAIRCTSDLAVDGEEALERLREKRFDLVLMDCMLPKISGYDATTLWRAIEETEHRPYVPIVALTANTLASNVELCAQAGMDDFLTKPVSLERLRETILARVAGGRRPDLSAPTAAPC